jgi:hypothetical protein
MQYIVTGPPGFNIPTRTSPNTEWLMAEQMFSANLKELNVTVMVEVFLIILEWRKKWEKEYVYNPKQKV